MTHPAKHPRNALMVIDQPAVASSRPSAEPRIDAATTAGSDLLNRALLAMMALVLTVAALGGWTTTKELSGAIMAPGQIMVDGSSKKVQHPAGGVVKSIRVGNGDRVASGALVMSLESVQPSADLAVLDARIVQLESEQARLEAEQEGRSTITLPLTLDPTEPHVAGAINRDRRLFEARRSSLASQRGRLDERIVQARKEVTAIHAQRNAKERELALVRQELRMIEDLYKQKLSNLARLLGMQREAIRFESEIESLTAQAARVESQIAEIELQALEIDQRLMVEAGKGIVSVASQLEEMKARRTAARATVSQTEMRAPVAGIVHDLAMHTIGGFLRGGEVAMTIVPDEATLGVELRVAQTDIDQIAIGQRAVLRLSAFSQRTTPEVYGIVTHVGADLTRDPTTGRSYFVARVAMDVPTSTTGRDFKLVPGMPVEGFVETGKRTALSLLFKPVSDQLARALREN